MSNYENFAYFYDELTSNIDYKIIAENYQKLILKYGGKTDGILLDLACGTGSLSEQFSALGFDVIGVDNSTNMLNAALDKKYESGYNIQYLCQDMTELDMFGTIDITVCALDSLNHLNDLTSLEKTIGKVSLFCEPKGLFLFDVNTVYKHKNVLAENTFVYDTENVFCVWQNCYKPENNIVDIHLDFFEKNDDNSYSRYEEEFSETAFSTEILEEILTRNGLEILEIIDYNTMQEVTETSEKLLYVTRKIK